MNNNYEIVYYDNDNDGDDDNNNDNIWFINRPS